MCWWFGSEERMGAGGSVDLGWRGDLLFGLKDGRDLCEGAAAGVAREGDTKVRVESRMEAAAEQGRGEQPEQRWREQWPPMGEVYFFHCF